MSLPKRLMRLAFRPTKLLHGAWRRFPVGSLQTRLDFDLFDRPNYAYIVWQAARHAKALGLPRISLLEFGVAGGLGLLSMEGVAREMEREFGIGIEIYGFDTGEGLPEPEDHRDLPYLWKAGFYKMDVPELERRLERSKLVLGNVKDTVPTFFETHSPAPVGAISLDLDFYSSTRDALLLLEADSKHFLPRTYCYFDDVMSSENGPMCADVGQLASIAEFNAAHPTKKVAQIHGLRFTRELPAKWNEQIYVVHDFGHPDYNTYVHPDTNRQLPLH